MPARNPPLFLLVLTSVFLGVAAANAQQDAAKKPVTLKVQLPHANAELTVNDTATKQGGTTRTFTSPVLDPGKEYTYTLTAKWRPNNYTTITRSKDITFKANGQEIEVDLREADPKRQDDILIRYVPTPQEIVDKMLEFAGVKKDDVVFDLGCGDGRIVVTAVQKFGAKRAVGVDIDPERIKDSNANAKAAGVEDKVEFRQQDVLKINDYSAASVVMLYMGNDLNLAVRPLLWKSLKPGTRVVSHRFTMGDWKPDKTTTVTDRNGEKYLLHLWTITGQEGKK